MNKNDLTKGIWWGLIGGLAGTIIMDLVIVGFFKAVGFPSGLIYSFIGDIAQSFFSKIGIPAPGGIPIGAIIHLLFGLSLGGLFGVLAARFKALRSTSIWKAALWGILYIEIVSQPFLVTAPLLRQMTTSDIVQWYELSTVMHMIYGAVLGGFTGYKLRVTN